MGGCLPMAVWGRWTLLCLSTGLRGGVGLGVEPFEGPIELSGEVTLEAASDLFGCSSLCSASFDVGAGFGVVGHAGDDGHVQRAVESPVAAAVEPVAGGVS